MIRLERSPLYGSVVALALTAVALLISLQLRPYLEPDIFLLFLVVVWLSAWYYGLIVGLVASGASALALLVFFFAGVSGFWEAGVRLGSFLGIAGMIIWMTAEWRESRRVLASTLESAAASCLSFLSLAISSVALLRWAFRVSDLVMAARRLTSMFCSVAYMAV